MQQNAACDAKVSNRSRRKIENQASGPWRQGKTNHAVRKIIALDAKLHPHHVPLQVSRNEAATAAEQAEGDAACGIALVPMFGSLPGKVLEALVISTGEEERATTSGALSRCVSMGMEARGCNVRRFPGHRLRRVQRASFVVLGG